MYIGKVRRGIGFLLLGCLIYSLLIVFLIFTIGVSIDQFFGLYPNQDTVPEINDNLIPQNSIDPMILLLLHPYVPSLYYWNNLSGILDSSSRGCKPTGQKIQQTSG